MSLPEPAAIEGLAIGELRSLVASVLAEGVRLRAENAALRKEVARPKGLPSQPKLKPSGMKKASQPPTPQPSGKSVRKRRRGVKRDRLMIGEERVLTAPAPAGSRFKSYEEVVVQDLILAPRVIRYRRVRWVTPDGQTLIASLPPGIVGGFGPALRWFILAGHAQGQVTSERLAALLSGIGIVISKRQVVWLLTGRLDTLVTEDREVLQAGLASAPPLTAPSRRQSPAPTGSTALRSTDHRGRHRRPPCRAQRRDHADRRRRFTVFRTSRSKSRTNFLDCLRAGHEDYLVDETALAYMRRHNPAGPVIDRLAAHPSAASPNGTPGRRISRPSASSRSR